VPAVVGKTIQPAVTDLPAKTKIEVSIIIDGKKVLIGEVKTDKNGDVILPALKFTTPGVQRIALTQPNGTVTWVKIKVKK